MSFTQPKLRELQKSLGVRSVPHTCPICKSPYERLHALQAHMKEDHADTHTEGDHADDLGLLKSRSNEALAREHRRQKANDKAPTSRPAAAERAGETGRQTTQRAPPPPETPYTAPGTSEGILIDSPRAAQPGSEENGAASRENPRKRRPPDLTSPEDNIRASSSPQSTLSAQHTHSAWSDQTPRERDPDYQASQTATLRSGAPRLSVGEIIPQKPTPPRGGKFNYPKASQYDSTKEAHFNRPADLGAVGHVPSALEPKSGKGTKPTPQRILRKNGPGHPPPPDELDEPQGDTSMLKQPDTRPISQDQLVVEVKGIYAGLVMVEAKCIEVDEQQKVWAQNKDYASRNPVSPDQWRSLIALHKQLLHEHHDFFLASQHPSASNNLSRLAAKYIMPARMWRHGIHGFLEVLRHRLPGSLEHMLTFIYIAYNMMALLFETVPSFEDTWVECLGDLGRYRMAIEDDEPRDREIWSNVARYWYSKASDKSPITGRLYHHLAILAKPNTLEHLCLYTKSLTCIVPFESAKGSILTLLTPVLGGKVSVSQRNLQIEIFFIKAHAILFTYRINDFGQVLQLSQSSVVNDFLYHEDGKGRMDNTWRIKKIGAYLAIANISAILEYGATVENGAPRSPIRRQHDAVNVKKGEEISQTEEEASDDSFMQNFHDTINIFELITRMGYHSAFLSPKEQAHSSTIVSYASELAFSTMKLLLSDLHWREDAQVWRHLLPFNHIMIVFIWSCCEAGTSIDIIEKYVPWAALCVYLNELALKGGGVEGFVKSGNPFYKHGVRDGRPLWEDFLLRGLTYTLWYFPRDWYSKSGLDDEESKLELSSMDGDRISRILWLGLCIASYEKWIIFDKETRSFEPAQFVTEPAYTETRMKLAQNWEKSDEDSIMSDASLTGGGLANANVSPSDVSDVGSTSSPPTTLDDSMKLDAVNTEATENVLTPKATPQAIAADEPEDIPMIDLSPTKEVPPPIDEKSLSFEQVPSNNTLDLVASKTQEISDIRQAADDSKIE